MCIFIYLFIGLLSGSEAIVCGLCDVKLQELTKHLLVYIHLHRSDFCLAPSHTLFLSFFFFFLSASVCESLSLSLSLSLSRFICVVVIIIIIVIIIIDAVFVYSLLS